VSADSIVPSAGNPQALNRYAYALNNPVKYTDPTGHRVSCGDDVDGGCGGDDFTPPINGTSVTQKQGQAIYERAKQNPELLKYESVRFAARTYAENVAHEPIMGPAQTKTDVRDPDFVSVNVGAGFVGFWGGEVSFTINIYGDVFVGAGPTYGKSRSIVTSSIVAGQLDVTDTPSRDQLYGYNNGPAETVEAGFIVGGGKGKSGNTTATLAGLYTPQVGWSGTNSVWLFNLRGLHAPSQ
jgi:hypothetical protein